MAVLAVAAAGAAAGYATFGTATFLGVSAAGWGWAIGSVVGNALFAPKTNAEGPRLTSIKFGQSSYGATLPVVYGAMRVGANVIWAGEVEEIASRQKIGKNSYATNYSYRQSFAAALCEGPVAGVRRIWFDSELVYSNVDNDVISTLVNGSLEEQMTIYLGSETQAADATIEAEAGAGDVPGYRGVCYVVFESLDLTPWGNRIPSVTAEVVEAGAFAAPTKLSEIGLGGNGFTNDGATFTRCTDWPLKTATLETVDAEGNVVLTWSAIALTGFVETDRKVDANVNICINDPTIGFCVVTDDAPDYPTPAYIRDVWMVIDGSEIKVKNAPEPDYGINGQILRLGDYLYAFRGTLLCRWAITYDAAYQSKMPAISPDIEFDFETLGSMSGTFGYLATDGTFVYARNDGQSNAPIHKFDADLNFVETIGYPTSPGILQEGVFHVWDGQLIGFTNWFASASYDITQWSIDGGGNFTELGTLTDSTNFASGYLWRSGPLVAIDLAEYSMAPVLGATGRTLAQTITSIAGKVGVTAGELDVTDCTQTVRGFVIDRRMSARAALEPLLAAYAVDGVESNGKLKFVARGGSVAATIAYADMGAMSEAGDAETPVSSREREQQAVLPQSIDVQYSDLDAAYETGSQLATRNQTMTDQSVSVQLPMALQAGDGAQIAHRLLYEAWASRTRREFTTALKHAALEPTDVVLIQEADGTTVRERIVSRLEDDGILRWETLTDDDGAFTQVAAGVALPNPTTLTLPPTGTRSVLFEVPPISDEHSVQPGIYAAVSTLSGSWPGASLWTCTPGGVNYTLAANLPNQAVIGQATSALPDWQVTDGQAGQGSVDVSVFGGDLDTITTSAWLAGGNLALVGGELIRFATATSLGGSEYRLTGLLRGQHGTDYASTGHAAGDAFALLDPASDAHFVPIALAQVDADVEFRAVTAGHSVDATPGTVKTIAGRTLIPLSPVHITITREADGDRLIRWQRRTRSYQDWREAADIPNVDADSYQVQILNADTGTTLRTVTSTTESYTYSAADIATDFGAPPANIRIKVAQYSSLVGWGDYADVTIPWAGDFNASYSRDWNDSSVAELTGFGAGDEVTAQTTSSIWPASTKVVQLKNTFGGDRDVKARFDRVTSFRDGLLRVKLAFNSTSPRQYGVVARTTYWRNDNGGFGWLVRLNGANVELLYGTNADSATLTSVSSVAHGASSDTIVEIAWLFVGTSHKVWVNDVLKIDVTNANINTAGQCGLYLYHAFSGTGTYDDFELDYLSI